MIGYQLQVCGYPEGPVRYLREDAELDAINLGWGIRTPFGYGVELKPGATIERTYF